MAKFRLGGENFVRQNFCLTKSLQTIDLRIFSDKSGEISAWWRKFCPIRYVTLCTLCLCNALLRLQHGITSESMRRVGVIISIDKVQTRNIHKITYSPHERG